MNIQVTCALWPRDTEIIKAIREQVFVQEQGVSAELEWDGQDAHCQHVLVYDENQQAIATGRLQPDGKIGRMAVLAAHRGQGIGGKVLNRLIEIARDKQMAEVYLHAQTQALAFYQRHGFSTHGAEFDEAGIPHLGMTRTIAK